MKLSTSCPKPNKAEQKPRKYLPRSTKPLKRTALKPRTKKIPERNEQRIAKRHAAYRKVIASDFHKMLRYTSYVRSGGFCECKVCVEWRKVAATAETVRTSETSTLGIALTPIPVWFTKSGGPAYKRFRSTSGELHHDSYRYFGQENPEELHDVLWVWKSCHRRIEAQYGTRRRWLKGTK